MSNDRRSEARDEQAKRQQADRAKAASDDDQEEVSEEAFDSFLTAILMTPPDTLPPIPENKEKEK